MKESFIILTHRYIDGQMTADEEAAFMHDVGSDPLLAEYLREETALHVAILDDAYALAPSGSTKALVMGHVARYAAGRSAERMLLHGLVASIALLFVSVASVENDVMVPISSSPAPAPAPAPGVAPAPTVGPHEEGPRSRQRAAAIAVVEAEETTILVDEVRMQEDAVPNVQPLEADGSVMRSQLFLYRPDPAAPIRCISDVVATPSIVSARLALDVGSAYVPFVELGMMSSAYDQRVVDNGVIRDTTASAQRPFFSVGIQAPIATLPFANTPVRGSIALGATDVGPIANAEVLIGVVDVGQATLRAGLRYTVTAQPRMDWTIRSYIMPAISISMKW
ncbi:MAG: hypothetical protein JSS89_09230 [Bacteroidetes bacterium]|nr:hypothetical protein [Bacteroidota bacterium]